MTFTSLTVSVCAVACVCFDFPPAAEPLHPPHSVRPDVEALSSQVFVQISVSAVIIVCIVAVLAPASTPPLPPFVSGIPPCLPFWWGFLCCCFFGSLHCTLCS